MADVASLVVKVSTDGVNKAQSDLDKLAKQSGKTESATASLTKSFGVLNVALGAMAVGKLTTEFFKTADAMKLVEARVKLVSTATEKYSNIQKELVSIANENRTSFSATAQLYSKMKPDLDRVGVSTATVMKITDAFGKSLLIGGASAEEAASATLQFAQAMASGRLQGDEYRSMIENNPRLMRLMREELGKTSAEIKQMATDGKLTADVIGGVLVRGMEKLQKEVKTIPETIGSSFQIFKTELGLTVEQLDKTTGASDLVIKATKSLTEAVKEAPQYFERLNASMDDVEKRYPNIMKTLSAAGFVVGKLVDGAAAAGEGVAWVAGGAMSTLAYSIDGVLSIAVDEYDRVIAQDKAYKAQASKPLNIITSGQEDYEAQLKEKRDKAQKEKLEKDKRAAKDMADIETDLDLHLLAIRGQADREKEEKAKKVKEAQEKAIKDAERLEKEWASKKIDIDKSIAIATQDELAKPYIELQYKYEEDLEHFKTKQGAKERLTKQFNLELERLNKETAQKVDEENEKALEKEQRAQEKLKRAKEQSIQKELKLQEENFRIQARQVELLDDEADKQVALATLEYQRTEASLSAQVKLGEVSQDYYDQMMDAETKLLNKQKQDWTMYGQIINNTTGAMESSFTNFFDGTSDDFMKFGDLAKNILKEIYLEAVRVALVRPLVSAGVGAAMSLIGGAFTSGSSSTSLPDASTSTATTGSEPLMFAKGGSFSSPSLSQYSGQIVDKPTFFAFANGGAPNAGVMGEAGAEAIMPLTRTSSGNLGVEASGLGLQQMKIQIINESGTPMEVTKTTQTTDMEGLVIQAWISGISKNRMGSRDMLSGGR